MGKMELKHNLEILLNTCLALIAMLFASFLIAIGEVMSSMVVWFIFAVFIMLIMRRYLGVKKNVGV